MTPALNPALVPYLMSDRLRRVPGGLWSGPLGSMRRTPIEVWCSGRFLVQVFPEEAGGQRLSVSRNEIDEVQGRWRDGITWDDLQQIKREIGRGDRWAVEVFPAEDELVDVANMRHLFLLPEAPSFGWTRQKPERQA